MFPGSSSGERGEPGNPTCLGDLLRGEDRVDLLLEVVAQRCRDTTGGRSQVDRVAEAHGSRGKGLLRDEGVDEGAEHGLELGCRRRRRGGHPRLELVEQRERRLLVDLGVHRDLRSRRYRHRLLHQPLPLTSSLRRTDVVVGRTVETGVLGLEDVDRLLLVGPLGTLAATLREGLLHLATLDLADGALLGHGNQLTFMSGARYLIALLWWVLSFIIA